jgi:uncharacterized protein YndB with AHSA1/START domain
MSDIRHRVGIFAPQAQVFAALSTTTGLSSWWSTTTGEPCVGGLLSFYFGQPEPAAIMKVIELRPNSCIRWLCVDGPPDWIGSVITFALSELGNETILRFAQTGLPEPMPESMESCSTKWAIHLLGIKTWLEGGQSNVYPHDQEVSSWG